ncbi:MAG: hemolysin family protein [Dehalococcoidia bacterium]
MGVAVVVFLLLAGMLGFFGLSLEEAALTTVPHVALRQKAEAGSRRARLALEAMHRTRGLRTAFQFLRITVTLLLAFSVASVLYGRGLVVLGAGGGVLALALLILHIGGRRLGHYHALPVALLMAPLAYWGARLLSPAVKAAVPERLAPRNSPLDQLFAQSEGEPHPSPQTLEMIRSVLLLRETTVKEVMTPRVDFVAVEVGDSLERAAALMAEKGLHRLPVFQGTLDQVVGVLYARDLLGALHRGAPISLKALARPVLFVPETLTLDRLLHRFQEERIHMAMVVDEFGGVEGLVTLADLLEEVVGEMDEVQAPEPLVQPLGGGEALIDGRASLEVLQGMFGVRVQEERVGTLGGMIATLLGRLPAPGDSVEAYGLRFQVVATLGRRAKRVRVSPISKPEK